MVNRVMIYVIKNAYTMEHGLHDFTVIISCLAGVKHLYDDIKYH